MGSTGVDFALMVFDHTGGAERSYGDAAGQASGEPWAREVAFVEHHRRDRIVVRGTFAGHYVDADDEGEFIGREVTALFDELRNEVPEGSSAVILMAGPEDVDAMVSALQRDGGRLVRHHLTPEGAEELRSAVAGSPSAAPGPSQ
jgi:hypothetical protein